MFDSWPVEEIEEVCAACQGRGVQYEHLQRNGEWGDYPVPCGCQGPCDPPEACRTHGRCWSHSEWETPEEAEKFLREIKVDVDGFLERVRARRRALLEENDDSPCVACDVEEATHDTYGRSHTCLLASPQAKETKP